MESIRGISRRARWVKVAIVVAAGTLMGLLSAQTASAISIVTSPNRGDIFETTTSSPLVKGGQSDDVYHLVKLHSSSSVRSIELEAYYDQPLTSHYIEISDRIRFAGNNRCTTMGSAPRPFINVTLSVSANGNAAPGTGTVTYRIPNNRLCVDAPSATYSNPRGTANGYLYARYPVPLAFGGNRVNVDAETNLYRVLIKIEYGPGVVMPSTGEVLQSLFKVNTNPCVGVGCQRYIGATPVPAGSPNDRNIATLGPTNDGSSSGRGVYTNQRYTFGLPCSVMAAQRRTITVYDLDNRDMGGAWADVDEGTNRSVARFYIEKSINNQPFTSLARGDYLRYTDQYVTGGGATLTAPSTRQNYGGVWTIRPRDGSAVTTDVDFIMQPQTKYRIVVSALWSGNMMGLGLPEKTIFGVIDCNIGVDARITTNPATGVDPIEVGRVFDINADVTRSGNTGFNSIYNSDFKVWYDNGNSVYDAGTDALVCNVVRAGVSHTGTAALAAGSCPGVVADPSRNGGRAVQICSRLLLSPNAADTMTSIGTGATPGLIRCFKIGKYPHLEARNGDIFAGGQLASASPSCVIPHNPVVSSSQRQINGTHYTSYATYGVTSLGVADRFGSMGLSYDLAGAAVSDDLVFANTSAVDGYFDNPTGVNSLVAAKIHCLNDPFTLFGSRANNDEPGTSIDISSLTSDTNLTGTGTVRLYASQPIQAGQKLVIYARQANIELTSNITYADQAYGSINQIPQIVILTDRNLVVRENSTVGGGKVTQLDGIYAAKQNVYTCNLVPRLRICDAPLKFNGAVIAGGSTIPLRTSGADSAAPGAMAETFNLRSDMLLNQLPDANSPDVFVRTLSEIEVPPRF